MDAIEVIFFEYIGKNKHWFTILAKQILFRYHAVSQIMVEYLKSLKMQFTSPAMYISQICRQYHQEKKSK